MNWSLPRRETSLLSIFILSGLKLRVAFLSPTIRSVNTTRFLGIQISCADVSSERRRQADVDLIVSLGGTRSDAPELGPGLRRLQSL